MRDINTVPTISVVVPFHNEEPNVIELYGRLQGVIEELGRDYQFVFVDDGGRDRVGPVFASTIYLFDPSIPEPRGTQADLTLSQVRVVPPPFDSGAQKDFAAVTSGPVSRLSRRHTQ